jgi:hypothetical protein
MFSKKTYISTPGDTDEIYIDKKKYTLLPTKEMEKKLDDKNNKIVLQYVEDKIPKLDGVHTLLMSIKPFLNIPPNTANSVANADNLFMKFFYNKSRDTTTKYTLLFLLSGYEHPENIINLVEKLNQNKNAPNSMVESSQYYSDVKALKYSAFQNNDNQLQLLRKEKIESIRRQQGLPSKKEKQSPISVSTSGRKSSSSSSKSSKKKSTTIEPESNETFYSAKGISIHESNKTGGALNITNAGTKQLYEKIPEIYKLIGQFKKEIRYKKGRGSNIASNIATKITHESVIDNIIHNINASKIVFDAELKKEGLGDIDKLIKNIEERKFKDTFEGEDIELFAKNMNENISSTIKSVIENLNKQADVIIKNKFSLYENAVILLNEIDLSSVKNISFTDILANMVMFIFRVIIGLLEILGEILIMIGKIMFSRTADATQITSFVKWISWGKINLTESSYNICKNSMTWILNKIKEVFYVDNIISVMSSIYEYVIYFYNQIKSYFINPKKSKDEPMPKDDSLADKLNTFFKTYKKYDDLITKIKHTEALVLLEYFHKDLSNAMIEGKPLNDVLKGYMHVNRYITLETSAHTKFIDESHFKKMAIYANKIKNYNVKNYISFVEKDLFKFIKGIIKKFSKEFISKAVTDTNGNIKTVELSESEIKKLSVYNLLLSIVCKYIESKTNIKLRYADEDSFTNILFYDEQQKLVKKANAGTISSEQQKELTMINKLSQLLKGEHTKPITEQTQKVKKQQQKQGPAKKYIIFYSSNIDEKQLASLYPITDNERFNDCIFVCFGEKSLNLIAALFKISSFMTDFNKTIKTKKMLQPAIKSPSALSKKLKKEYRMEKYEKRALLNVYGENVGSNVVKKMHLKKVSSSKSPRANDYMKQIDNKIHSLETEIEMNLNRVVQIKRAQIAEQRSSDKNLEKQRENEIKYLESKNKLLYDQIQKLTQLKSKDLSAEKRRYEYKQSQETFTILQEMYKDERLRDTKNEKLTELRKKLKSMESGITAFLKKSKIKALKAEIQQLEADIQKINQSLAEKLDELKKM